MSLWLLRHLVWWRKRFVEKGRAAFVWWI